MTTPPNPPAPPHRPRLQWLAPTWARKHRHLTVPLLAVPAVFPAAGAILYFAGPQARIPVLAVAVVLTGCVWFFAPHKWRDRTPEQVYAVYSAAAAGGWLAIVAWNGFTLVTWSLAGGLAIVWGVPWWWHHRKHLYSSTARLRRDWNNWWQANSHLWGGHGSGVIDVDPRRDVEELRVQLVPGVHAGVLDDWLPKIESVLRGYVRHGMIRGRVDPHRPDQALIQLRRENPLQDNIEWDPAAAPSTITEPAPIGKHGFGDWIKTRLTRNWMFVGMTRWGKSTELSTFLATITQCDDALPWLIDMKGGRATRPWLAALDWAAVTIEEARLLLDCALAEIQARAEDADDSEEQLTPTRDVPALFVIIDETHEVTSLTVGDTHCANQLSRVVSLGNGLAVYSVVSTQHGTLDESVRYAQTRANLEARLCFHVADAGDGRFALPDWNKLDASKLDVPGSFYYQLGAQAAIEDARGPHMPHDLVRAISAANGQARRGRPPLRLYCGNRPISDEPGAPTWQQVYDERWLRLPAKFWKDAPQTDDLTAAPAPPPAAAPADTGQAREAAERAARIEADIAGTPDVNPAQLARIPSELELETETLRKKAAFAQLLRDADPHISPNDLVKGSGMSRPWIMAMLADLRGDEVVIKDGRGQYRAVAGADVWAAIEAVQDRRAAMLPAGAR